MFGNVWNVPPEYDHRRRKRMEKMDYSIRIPFWNQKDITPPIIISVKLPSNAQHSISGLRLQLVDAQKQLALTDALHKEAAVLSRLIYIMKRSFRQDKGFKCAQMLLKTLRNTLSLNFKLVVSSLRDCCHGSNGPSKQMIEWGLVCTMRFGALFHRIHYLAERAATIFKERLKSGWSWLQATLCVGIISRLWALADFFVARACTWYSSLHSFLPVMTATDDEWLPKNVTLPTGLASWLGNPSYLVIPQGNLPEGTDVVDTTEKSIEKLNIDSKQDKPPTKTTKTPLYQLSDILKRSNAMELDEDMGEAVPQGVSAPERSGCAKEMKRKAHTKDKFKLKKKRKKV